MSLKKLHNREDKWDSVVILAGGLGLGLALGWGGGAFGIASLLFLVEIKIQLRGIRYGSN